MYYCWRCPSLIISKKNKIIKFMRRILCPCAVKLRGDFYRLSVRENNRLTFREIFFLTLGDEFSVHNTGNVKENHQHPLGFAPHLRWVANCSLISVLLMEILADFNRVPLQLRCHKNENTHQWSQKHM